MQLRFGQRVFAPTLIPTVVFIVVLGALLSLGNWQMQRAGEKQALVEEKQTRQKAAPLDLNRAIVDAQLDRFRPARVVGRYATTQQWLLDNRLFQGQAGYHVFSLLQLDDGGQLLVNRGWVAVGETREFLPELPLPQGPVKLSGHLDRPESVGLVLGEPPLDSIANKVLLQSLDIEALAKARNLELQPLSLVLDEAQSGSLQYDWMPVETISPEKHVGYAVQWFALAVALVIIYFGVNTRRVNNEET
jgi:surfeit locus 1 family protein